MRRSSELAKAKQSSGLIYIQNPLKTKKNNHHGNQPGEDPKRVIQSERQNLKEVSLILEREAEKTMRLLVVWNMQVRINRSIDAAQS